MLDGNRRGRRLGDLLPRIDDGAHRRGFQIEAERIGGHDGVEGAAIGDVDRHRPPGAGRRDALERIGEGRHAVEAHHAVAGDAAPHQPAGTLQAHDRLRSTRLRLARCHAAAVDRPAGQRDRGVAAHRAVALVVHEQHGEVGLGMVGLDQQRAIHAVVAARLQHQPAPQMVEARLRLAPLVEERAAFEFRPAVDDDARGLAARMHLDGREDHPKTSGSAAPMRSFIISIEPSV